MAILWPVFALFALTTVLTFRLGFMRVAAVKRRDINPKFFRAFQGYDEPDFLRVPARHVVNLFEAPVLFYVVAILIYVTAQVSGLLVALSWLYVAARCAHSYIHLTSNVVIWRLRVFAVSWLVLVVLWLTFLVQLMASRGGG